MKNQIEHLLIALAWLACCGQVLAFNEQGPGTQGTAFTYQGRLYDNGGPANGLYDVRFAVWDAPTNGNLVAGPLTNCATAVANGLFVVTLDFGSGVFTGPSRWLELDVRTNGNGEFVTVQPFQPILQTPYAIMANTASNLLGTLPAAQLSGTAGNFSATNITVIGTITGDGSALTNLNPANFTAGTAAINISGNAALATNLGGQLFATPQSGVILSNTLVIPAVASMFEGGNKGEINFFRPDPNGNNNASAITFWGLGINPTNAATFPPQGIRPYLQIATDTGPTSPFLALFDGFQNVDVLKYFWGTNGDNGLAGRFTVGAGGIDAQTNVFIWIQGPQEAANAGLIRISLLIGSFVNSIQTYNLSNAPYDGVEITQQPGSTNSAWLAFPFYKGASAAAWRIGISTANPSDGNPTNAFELRFGDNYPSQPYDEHNAADPLNRAYLHFDTPIEADGNPPQAGNSWSLFNTTFSNNVTVVSNLSVNGNLTVGGGFSGNGSGLTNLITPTAANYLHSYSTTTQAVATAGTFQYITNQVDAQISGWTHTAGRTSFTNAQSGLYLVEYTAEATTTSIISGAATVSLRAVVNGTEIADSQSTAVVNTANQVVPISKSFMANFNSGDVLQFQFAGSSTTVRIVSGSGLGTIRPSFSCTIIRLH